MSPPDQEDGSTESATHNVTVARGFEESKHLLRLIYIAISTTLLATLMACCLLSTTIEHSTVSLLFGWFFLIQRLCSEIEFDVVAIVFGTLLVGSFIGLFAHGWNWLGQRHVFGPLPQSKWNGVRAALVLVLAFTAGLGFVGLVSTIGWILTTEEPLISGGRGRTTEAYSVNNLKLIAFAVHNYEETNHRFPPGGAFDGSGCPMQSWQTHLLPFMDRADLYRKMEKNLPWNASANAPHVATMLNEWMIPGSKDTPNEKRAPAPTHYEANV